MIKKPFPNALLAGVLACFTSVALADIKPEILDVAELEVNDHTLLVNTYNDKAVVIDADSGEMLGMLSFGIGANAVEFDKAKGVMYVAENYYSRHTRGERTDVVTTYDIKTLSAQSEVVIPPKHSSGAAIRHYSGLTDDRRFMLVNNVTPAMSVSVVDTRNNEFVTEISTAGCGLIYPLTGYKFLQLCGDGAAQVIVLGDDGKESERIRSDQFFDLDGDPLMEKSVRTDSGWIFSTFKGRVFRINHDDGWDITELFQLDDGTGSWRLGGVQPLALHGDTNTLLALMHQGGEGTHKDPGTAIWMYDLSRNTLIHQMTLQNAATSIQVSQDDAPLLYAAMVGTGQIDIYDLGKTRLLRSTTVGLPHILQTF